MNLFSSHRALCGVISAVAILLAAEGASAKVIPSTGLINVDFNTSSSPTYTGPAVLGIAGDKWNSINGLSTLGGPFNLVDSANNATALTLSYSNTKGFFNAGNSIAYTGTEIDLMGDYMYVNGGGTATVSLSGLTPNGRYNLVLYSIGNGAGNLDTDFTVGGVTKVANNPQGNTVGFVENQDYVRFVTSADLLGKISIDFIGTLGNTGNRAGNLNGLQLSTVPEASTLVLSLAGCAGMGLVALRKKLRRG